MWSIIVKATLIEYNSFIFASSNLKRLFAYIARLAVEKSTSWLSSFIQRRVESILCVFSMFPSVNSPTLSAPDKCFPPCSQDSFFLFLFLLSFVPPTNNLLTCFSSLALGQRNAPNAEKCAKCKEMRQMQRNVPNAKQLVNTVTYTAPPLLPLQRTHITTYHSSFLKSLFFISFPTGTCAAGNESKFFH